MIFVVRGKRVYGVEEGAVPSAFRTAIERGLTTNELYRFSSIAYNLEAGTYCKVRYDWRDPQYHKVLANFHTWIANNLSLLNE